jgi:RNA polymerase sigma-70 factor, ECF subfamily
MRRAARDTRRDSRGDDRSLVARLRVEDRDAVAELYQRFGAAVFAFLLKTLRERAAAEDVQQQVFLEAWQRAASYDPSRGGLLTWLLTIARSRAIDHLRRRVPEPAGAADDLPAAGEHAIDEVDALVERYRVAALLSALHPEEARILRMRFYDDLSQTQIAERTGIPLGTVKMRMARALASIRDRIGEEGG